MAHTPACYFCPSVTARPVVTYVSWVHPCPDCNHHGAYAFLCAEHRAEHADRVHEDYSISYGIEKIDAIR